jgi:hypothetical protein
MWAFLEELQGRAKHIFANSVCVMGQLGTNVKLVPIQLKGNKHSTFVAEKNSTLKVHYEFPMVLNTTLCS